MTGLPEAGVAAVIDAARNGRPFLLVGGAAGEGGGGGGGGVLAVAAQMATPDAINLLARHGRGLVSLALTRDRAAHLRLRPMVSGADGERAAVLTSIEARDGVSTGISAGDRARTVAVAINTADPDALVTPGHMFPVVAGDGGVLARPGLVEAAIDIARLSGLNASAVFTAVLDDEGAVAGVDALARLAETLSLAIVSVADLVAYRLRHDRGVDRIATHRFDSIHGGLWTAITFRSQVGGAEYLALVKGDPASATRVPVRLHALSPLNDALGERRPQTGLLQEAMRRIGAAGVGVIVVLHDRSPVGLSAALAARGGAGGAFERGVGAQILADLGVARAVLLIGDGEPPSDLETFGLPVAGTTVIAVEPLAGAGIPAAPAPPHLCVAGVR